MDVLSNMNVTAFLNININTPNVPASGTGITFSWNYSSGQAEVALWNVFNSATKSFVFKQKTGASTFKDLCFMDVNAVYPGVDNSLSLGTASFRWTAGYFTYLSVAESTAPTSSSDASGTVGDIRYVGNSMYRKTSTGWIKFTGATF